MFSTRNSVFFEANYVSSTFFYPKSKHIESPPKLNADINTSQEFDDPPSFDSQTTVMTESVRQTAQIEIEKNIEISAPIADIEVPVVEDCKPDNEDDKTETIKPNEKTDNDKNHLIQQPVHIPVVKDKEEVKNETRFDFVKT